MRNKEQDCALTNGEWLWGKKFFWIPFLFMLGLVFAMLQPVRLGEGGEVTLLSMLFIFMISYCYGGGIGTLTSALFGIARYMVDYYITEYIDFNNVKAEQSDYLFGYILMGLAGFFVTGMYKHYKKRMDNDPEFKDRIEHVILVSGYSIAALLHYGEGVYNCYHYYEEQREPLDRLLYSLNYAFGYIGVEAIITIILLLCIPPLYKALIYVRRMATEDYDPNLEVF